MEKKLMIADFAALVGTTSKTIYQKINKFDELPVNEKLVTVKEKVKGREVTLIVTNSEQINYYKTLYGKNPVIESKYYETLTDNESLKPVNNVSETVENLKQPVKTLNNGAIGNNLYEQLLTINNDWNDRYEQKTTEVITLYKELADVKGRQLLLEDKAGREGLYIKEINELKTDNKTVKKANEILKYVIMGLLIVIVGLVMYLVMVNNVSQPVTNVSEQVTNVQQPVQIQAPAATPPAKSVKKK